MTTSAISEDAPTAGGADARSLFETQRIASRRDPAPSLEARKDSLEALRRLVSENGDAFADAISQDFGNRSKHETQLMEVVPLIGTIAHTRKHLARWMRPEKRRTEMNFKPGTSWVRYEPLGVVGIISPWNYPLVLSIGPLIDVLAAGNRALLSRPS